MCGVVFNLQEHYMKFTFKCKENSFDIDGKSVILLDNGPLPLPSPPTDVAIFNQETKELRLYIRPKQCECGTVMVHEEYIFPKAEILSDNTPIVILRILPQENCVYFGWVLERFCIDNIVDTVTDIHCETTNGYHKVYVNEEAMLYDCLVNGTNIRCHPGNPMITSTMRTAFDELSAIVSIMKDSFEKSVKQLIDEKITDIHCR